MPYILDWLGDFWFRIGRFFMQRVWFFGEAKVGKGVSHSNHGGHLQVQKLWFCVKNERGLVQGEMAKASLGRVKQMADASLDVVVQSPEETKVVWFGHR